MPNANIPATLPNTASRAKGSSESSEYRDCGREPTTTILQPNGGRLGHHGAVPAIRVRGQSDQDGQLAQLPSTHDILIHVPVAPAQCARRILAVYTALQQTVRLDSRMIRRQCRREHTTQSQAGPVDELGLSFAKKDERGRWRVAREKQRKKPISAAEASA